MARRTAPTAGVASARSARVTCSASEPWWLSSTARAAVCSRSRSAGVSRSARRMNTPPCGWCTASPSFDWLVRTRASSAPWTAWAYEVPSSFTSTRSTASCFSRQYSCARRSWWTISWSSASSIRTTTIGRAAGERGGPRRRPQRRIGVEDAIGEALEEVRLVQLDAQMVELDLRLGARERDHAIEGRRIPIFVGEVDDGLARGGHHGGERDPRGGAGGELDAGPQAEDRGEHRAGRVGGGAAAG